MGEFPILGMQGPRSLGTQPLGGEAFKITAAFQTESIREVGEMIIDGFDAAAELFCNLPQD